MFNTERIEFHMNKRGWTKYRLAKEANIGQSTLSEILSGKKKNPSITTLKKISTALEVPMSAILGENSFSINLICALQSAYHNNSHDGVTNEFKFWEFISEKLSIDYDELSVVVSDKTAEYSIETQLKLIDDFKKIDYERYLDFVKYNAIPIKLEDSKENDIEKAKTPIVPIIPEEFTNPVEARAYINKHQIFGSNGFDSNKLSDDEILQFANELLAQMKMVSYKYKK